MGTETATTPAWRRAARAAYRSVPFKREVLTALRGVWQPPERVYRHLHFQGAFEATFAGKSFQIFHSGTILENTLFWEGVGASWERVSLQLWARLAPDARVVLDIGANTGVYSTIAAAQGAREVIAFEPNPAFCDAISRSNTLNGFRIQIVPVALSDSQGTIAFSGYQVDDDPDAASRRPGWTSVPRRTLASFLEERAISSVDLIKCDVERHEPAVFRGMGRHLAEQRPSILVEILDDECAGALAEVFAPAGYRYYSIDDARGSIRQVPTLRRSDHMNVLLCRPEIGDRLEADRSLPWR